MTFPLSSYLLVHFATPYISKIGSPLTPKIANKRFLGGLVVTQQKQPTLTSSALLLYPTRL